MVQEYYSKEKNCSKELLMARKIFSDKNTTEEQYDNMERCLAFMYAYGPEKLQDMIWGTMVEATMRKGYFNF